MDTSALRDRFRALHESGLFTLPNPFDVGSALRLAEAGHPALATTSSGHAATLGRGDQQLTRDELVAHVSALTAAVEVPVNVDAECCYPGDEGGVPRTVELLAEAGAAGVSIEDYVPGTGPLPIETAADRVAQAADVAHRHGVLLTARAEGFLYDQRDLDAVVQRLTAYRDAGADVLYAPGLTEPDQIAAVVSLGKPVNVLLVKGAPPLDDLAALGVRRVSTGGALTWAAYDAAVAAAPEPRG